MVNSAEWAEERVPMPAKNDITLLFRLGCFRAAYAYTQRVAIAALELPSPRIRAFAICSGQPDFRPAALLDTALRVADVAFEALLRAGGSAPFGKRVPPPTRRHESLTPTRAIIDSTPRVAEPLAHT